MQPIHHLPLHSSSAHQLVVETSHSICFPLYFSTYKVLSRSGLKLVITQGVIFLIGKVGKNQVITRVRTPLGDLPGTVE
jgi:hypothetical protein